MATQKLSDSRIRGLKPKERIYTQSDGDGLMFVVHPNATRRWVLKFYLNGKDTRVGLGTYPTVSLKDARELAQKYRGYVAKGIDPRLMKQGVNGARTFGALADEWYGVKATSWSEQHAKDVKANLRLHLKGIANCIIDQITPVMLLSILKKLAEEHCVTAHRSLSICKCVMDYAHSLGIIQYNPFIGLSNSLPKIDKSKHFSTITDEKNIGILIDGINNYPKSIIVKFALLLSAYTFCRPQEIYAAQWNEVNLEKKLWIIPASRMKKNKDHYVPLSTQSQNVLESMKLYSHDGGKSGWVFESMRGKSRHISENTVRAALRLMGYGNDDMTAHGFRGTASTILYKSGLWRDNAIEYQLSHGEPNAVKAAYNHADYLDERTKMMQWYADKLDELGTKAKEEREAKGMVVKQNLALEEPKE